MNALCIKKLKNNNKIYSMMIVVMLCLTFVLSSIFGCILNGPRSNNADFAFAYNVQDNGDVVSAESKAISTVSQLKIFMSGDANQGVAEDASYAAATDGHLTQ
ncbi:MAG: hypothetical protein RR334_00490, partial [Clostridia bacterium]